MASDRVVGGGRVLMRDILDAPFLLRCETIRRPDGSWARRVSYPELGVELEGDDTTDILAALEIRKIQRLVDTIELGSELPRLRDPVPHGDLEDLLTRAGLGEWIERLDDCVEVEAR